MPIQRFSLLVAAALCTIDALNSQSMLAGEQGAGPSHQAGPALRSAVRTGRAQVSKVLETVPGDYDHPVWLQSCKSILLDLGSNNGVNVRKMYEPEKYGGAKVLPYLSEVFGQPDVRRSPASKTGLCALGLEPNPEHHERLQMVQQAYRKQGWNVHFYPFAAWSKDGFMPLNMTGKKEPATEQKAGEGSHLSMRSTGWTESRQVATRTVDLAAFIKSLPAQSVKLMIMDIEGAEYQSLAQLIQKNVLCHKTVQKALIAAHTWGEITHWGDNSTFHVGVHPRSFVAVQQRMDQLKDYEWCAPGKVTEVSELDDSMYSQDLVESPFF